MMALYMPMQPSSKTPRIAMRSAQSRRSPHRHAHGRASPERGWKSRRTWRVVVDRGPRAATAQAPRKKASSNVLAPERAYATPAFVSEPLRLRRPTRPGHVPAPVGDGEDGAAVAPEAGQDVMRVLPHGLTIAKGVQDAAYQRGYTVMFGNTDEDPMREERFLQALNQHRFAGLIIVPTERSRELLARYARTPVVEVDRASGREDAHVILADNVASSRGVIAHLAGLGHTRIATVTGSPSVTTGAERLQGYHDGMRAAGLAVDPEWIARRLGTTRRRASRPCSACSTCLRADGRRRSSPSTTRSRPACCGR
jgi:hypothetical protein